jgi:hypothetical protein
MNGWYKKSALANELAKLLVVWLRNARNHANFGSVHDDISYQMQGADNAFSLNNAITVATGIIQREQGGYLTPSQTELLQNIQHRIQDQAPQQIMIQQNQPVQQNMDINENAQNAQELKDVSV